MRIVLAIIGGFLGATLATGSRELFGFLLGAFAGFAFADLTVLRNRLRELEDEVSALRTVVARRTTRPEAQDRTRDEEADWRATVRPDTTAAPGRATTDAPRAASYAAAAAGQPTQADHPTPTAREAADLQRAVPPRGLDVILRVVREYFTGGNTLVRIGIIILFFGVAFLLRYVAEHSKVPIEFRLSGVAVAAILLLVLGWRLRATRPGYALALQGGAVGILYLTVFASLRLYALLPPVAAFALLVFLAAVSAALAVLQNSQAFALLSLTGGFLAPILASTGQGSHLVLFSYYAVLNGGILAVAWFKAWRALNLAGFLFTFVIGTAWGVLRYQPAFFATTEPFLILFFLFYVAIAILFGARRSPELRGYIDGTLVFGTPIVAFGLQSGMLHERPFALAYSALALSALYLVIAVLVHRARRESQRLLVEAFMALGVLFLTLAVPLAFDGRWSAATWALEGGALVWIGCRQWRRLPRAFGALLQLAGGVIFWLDIDAPHGRVPILNSACLGGHMVSAAAVFSAAMLQRYRERLLRYELPIAPILFFWGLLWWLFCGLTEIQRRVPDRYDAAAGLLFVSGTALLCSQLHARAGLGFARLPALWLLPAMILYAALAVVEVHHPFADAGWLTWPLAFAALYLVFRRHEGPPGSRLANVLHAGALWLMTALVSWEVAWAINRGVAGGGSWPVIAWALIPAITLFSLPRLVRRIQWPLGLHRQAYIVVAGAGLTGYLALWSISTNVRLAGDPYPLAFVPVLNPLDLAQAFVLLVLLRFWMHLRAARYPALAGVREAPVFATLAALAFVWLNAALLRTLHHWAGVPYEIHAMLLSTLVQTALSIFWAVLALTTMLAATRTRVRSVWLAGAGLLAVVIAKLFLIDLSHIGTIERIVSFVGVGLLMLVIGYFSPLPPAIVHEDAAASRAAG